MKKFLVLAAVICCSFALFAKIGDPKPELIQLTFGLGADAESGHQAGLTVGADIDWNVWEKATTKAHDGSGKMYAGLDIAAQWWLPTEDGFKDHWIMIPVQGNFMYLFDTTKMKGAGPLIAVGPWISTGIGFNVHAWQHKYQTPTTEPEVDDQGKPVTDDKGKPVFKQKTETESKADFDPSIIWEIGVALSFKGNWGLKVGFGENHFFVDYHWHKDYFMAEAVYRF